MNTLMRFAVAAAAIAAVAVAGLYLLPRAGGVAAPGPTPTLTPSPTASPTQAPTPSPTARADGRTNLVAGGPLSVVVPAGWRGEDWFVTRGETGSPSGMVVYFDIVANLYSDPCAHVLRDPPVGPSVEDLVTALGEFPNTIATEPVDATLGGRPARYVELTFDDPLPCGFDSFSIFEEAAGGGPVYAQGVGQIVQSWVLDVDGTRVLVNALRYPAATDEMLAEMQSVIDSIVFE